MLYMRGHANTIETLKFIERLLPYNLTTHFVLQGCSAGAISTFAWADFVMNYIRAANPYIQYFAIPDSAFYINYKS